MAFLLSVVVCRYHVDFTEGIHEFRALRMLYLLSREKKKHVMMCNLMI